MLIDEFANTRMWAAEAERQQREREQARRVREHEQARRVREHGGRLRSAGRKARDAGADAVTGVRAEPADQDAGTRQGETAAAGTSGSGTSGAQQPNDQAATPQLEASASQERELAHAGR